MDGRSKTGLLLNLGLLSTLQLVGPEPNSPLNLLRSSVAACTRASKPPRPALERADGGELSILVIDAADGRDSTSFGEPCVVDNVRDPDVGSRVDGGLVEDNMVGLDGPIIPGPRRKVRMGS